MDDNWRWQQELEEEREQRTLEALDRIDKGHQTHDDVEFLASELGVKLTQRRAA